VKNWLSRVRRGLWEHLVFVPICLAYGINCESLTKPLDAYLKKMWAEDRANRQEAK